MVDDFLRRGWTRFSHDPLLADWAQTARTAGLQALNDPALAHWNQCEGTWFVGVDALPNDAEGRIGSSGPLIGEAVDFLRQLTGRLPEFPRAQLSVVRSGYPKPRQGEGPGAFRYRQRRDAAHVDGILASGPDRGRFVREPHAFILGVPLNSTDPGAAPLVVWEGSQDIMRKGFLSALAHHPVDHWADVDVTDAYRAARNAVFSSCPRRVLHAAPGEAFLLHPLVLHGISAFDAAASAPPEGRMTAYFRPAFDGSLQDWVSPDLYAT